MIAHFPRQLARGSFSRSRRGIILILVLIVVVMVSLAGFGFVVSMSNENKAVRLRGEQLQMENAINSAEEFLKQHLNHPSVPDTLASSSYDLESLMRGVVVADENGPHCRVRFTAISPRFDDTGIAPWRYGYERESSRLDLRAIMEWETRQSGSGRLALLGLPGMTESIADALLDWMDNDNTPRPSGAERDFYAALNPPYAPRNGIPDSLEELLLVKGVTRLLLFGSDANQNHHLEPEELSGGNRQSPRESRAERQIGWGELLTLYSNERNQSRGGLPRIDLNQPDLFQLHTQLSTVFDQKLATFAVLYRQYGPSFAVGPLFDVSTQKPDLSLSARYRIHSPLELIQSRVQVRLTNGTASLIGSPLSNSRENQDKLFDALCDRVTVSNERILRGRVNINLAPVEVLRCVPGIDKGLAEQINSARRSSNKGHQQEKSHPCWLFTDGLIPLNKMQELFPYITAGGDAYRTQIVAFSETSRLSHRVEFVIDTSTKPARRVFWKDLQVLGRGYPWDVLDTPGGVSYTQTGASDATSIGP